MIVNRDRRLLAVIKLKACGRAEGKSWVEPNEIEKSLVGLEEKLSVHHKDWQYVSALSFFIV